MNNNLIKKTIQIKLLNGAKKGNLKKVKLMLKRGADINFQGKYGITALDYAAAYGHLNVMNFLIENGAENINYALNMASSNGHSEVVKLLVDQGADVNYCHVGQSVLELAIMSRCPRIVKILLENGADVNNKQEPLLVGAAFWRNLIIVKLLVDAGADINAFDKYGSSALSMAADKGYPDVVTFLMIRGADPTIKNKRGETALDVASTDEIKDLLNSIKSKKA